MLGLKIDFTWAVFADYKVEDPGPLPLPEEGSEDDTLVGWAMAVTGYDRGPELVASGNSIVTRPLDKFPDLYLRLAQAEPTVAGHKAFATKYGLLTARTSELTSLWVAQVEHMRKLIAMVRDKANWDVQDGRYAPYELPSSFSLRFRLNDETDEMSLSIAPNCLYVALALQCLAHCTGGAQIRSCKQCGLPFEIGGATGRRSHAEFCSPKCRFDFNHRNRKGKQ
jgi:hypothetical protein